MTIVITQIQLLSATIIYLDIIERPFYILIMARPVEYDKQVVLDKATELFWKNGFEATSVSELVVATGLNKRTMYNLYDDKQGLFDACLNNYLQKYLMGQINVLKNNDGIVGINKFFSVFEFHKDFIGCLFANTVIEKNVVHESSMQIIQHFFNEMKDTMIINLEQAREDGDFSGDASAVTLTLLCLAQGLSVSGKMNSSSSDCKLIVETALSLIK
ncbi:MAG: TetR/AcrR family transcriptional regulator [Pseudomonadales bacterium]|nr:TetR/AcrR family transcriptional regulator [Pseudomonadales bacterium]